MTKARLLSALLGSVLLASCGLLPEQIDETKDWTASKFYAEAAEALANKDYEQAIKYYEGLEARFPFGPYALQAQLDVAYAYYLFEEPDSALAAADRFIRLHPRNPFVDYAYYLKGIVNFNRSVGFFDRFVPTDPSQRDPGSALDSFKDFSELVRRFPDSRYAPDARKRMLYLRNNLAQYQVNVADYYYRRGAYLAAANRGVYVVEHFQRSPAVKPALQMMIKAYRKLDMEKLAADAERVLVLNEQKRALLAPDSERPKKWGEQVWDFFGLDKN